MTTPTDEGDKQPLISEKEGSAKAEYVPDVCFHCGIPRAMPGRDICRTCQRDHYGSTSTTTSNL